MNAVWNQGFLFDVKNETIDDYSVTIKVMNHDLLKNDELIGQVIIGPHSKGSGREHWEEAMRNKHNRREVAMTHILEWDRGVDNDENALFYVQRHCFGRENSLFQAFFSTDLL